MNYNDLIKVEIAGVPVSSAISGGGFALLLKECEGERRIPIIIGHFEAQAIAFEIEGLKPPRPLTHELIKNMLKALSYSVERVIISELRDSTFIAKIILDSEEIEPFDARPSDAIALSLKFKSPIYFAREVIDEVGFLPQTGAEDDKLSDDDFDMEDFNDEEDTHDDERRTEASKKQKEEKLKKLQRELEDAVSNEDYERAAELRDQIKQIEISNLN